MANAYITEVFIIVSTQCVYFELLHMRDLNCIVRLAQLYYYRVIY